jgi:eukaryotic-like serine/threonine-protein kinase
MSDIQVRLIAALADRYRIEREIGQGGMATVYLAHDLRHERDVAIKVLHPDLGAALGGERFLTEIRTTARLQHPHILPLLDSGEADGLLYYVMPLVTGETLRSRLERERQLSIADAVRIASEIASALDYAHRQNVIHRDIKPENVLLHDGQAIVADFGIALAVQSAGGQRMTQTGLSLGTPQYMSPEQAMGERAVDARSDIYALGAVTYEMLAGEPPFSGPTVQAIVAKVLSERPTPLHRVRDTVPAPVEQAVLAALAKLPADRPATAAAFMTMLSQSTTAAAPFAGTVAPDRRAVRWWQGIAVILMVALAGSAFMATRTPPSPAQVVRFALPAPTLNANSSGRPAISPDGRIVAYADPGGAEPGIRVRWIDREATEVLSGTATARNAAFAPDGRTLAYTTLENGGTLNTAGIDGRNNAPIVRGVSEVGGLAWGRDGFIYFVELDRISRVPANGGTREVLFSPPDESIQSTAEGGLLSLVLLDDGRSLVSATRGAGQSDGNIILVDIAAGTVRVLGRGMAAVGVRDGWLLFAKLDGSVVAQRLDVAKQQLVGAAVPLLSGVYQADATPFLAMGRDGSLVHQSATSTASRLVWVSRAGIETEVDSTLTREFGGLAVAPAGDRIAVSIGESANSEAIWLYDLARRTLTRLTPSRERSFRPTWTPDGARVLFVGDRGGVGQRRIFSMAPDGTDSLREVVSRTRLVQEISWPAGGGWFAFREGWSDGGTMRDIYAMMPGDTTARAVVATAADESNPAVSGDGRWLAYVSNASGFAEVYLTPFPTGGARIQLSTSGGSSPVWSRDGRELYYRDSRGMLIATAMTTSAANPVGTSRPLFDASQYHFDEIARSFDVSADGRFLFIKPPARANVSVVLNWWTEALATLAAAERR